MNLWLLETSNVIIAAQRNKPLQNAMRRTVAKSDMQAFCSYVPKQYIAWTQSWQCDLQPGKVNEHLQHTQGARFQRTKIAISLVRSTPTILRKVCAGNSQIAILQDPTKRLHRHHATKLYKITILLLSYAHDPTKGLQFRKHFPDQGAIKTLWKLWNDWNTLQHF